MMRTELAEIKLINSLFKDNGLFMAHDTELSIGNLHTLSVKGHTIVDKTEQQCHILNIYACP